MCVCVSIDVKTHHSHNTTGMLLVPLRGTTITKQKFSLIMFKEVFGAGLTCDISHRAL